jgi:putative ABC transport system ATP-binding protein
MADSSPRLTAPSLTSSSFISPSLISLSAIARTFYLGDSEVHALRDVELNIAAGEYIAVMGPSGSGKSTLLNLIGLLDRPDIGTYTLEGRDVTTLKPDEQALLRSERIGFIFQSFHLVPRLSAAANIELPLMLAGVAAAERTRRVAQAIKDFGLSDRAQHQPNQLSGGQRQRVAIARATVQRPAVLLADEPTGNLDRVTGEEVLRLLEALNAAGTTLIIVTHDHALGARAHRQILMEDGRIVSDIRREPDAADSSALKPVI